MGAVVPMVPFARLVVIADHAVPTNHEGQSVLEFVHRTPNRHGDPPEYHLGKCGLREPDTLAHEQHGSSVGHNTNTMGSRQGQVVDMPDFRAATYP